MIRPLLRSRKGISTLVAQVTMVLITIALSALVLFWVSPTFTGNLTQDNSRNAYSESFNTLTGSFVYSYQVGTDPVRTSPGPWSPNKPCTSSSPVSTPYAGNILVPVNENCIISASVTGNVFASQGANLTVRNTVITGGLNANYSSQVSVSSVIINGVLGSYNVRTVTISASTVGGELYVGGPAIVSMVGTTVNNKASFEVNKAATVIGNTVTGQLEVEADGTAQVTSNIAGSLKVEENGAAIVQSNTVAGSLTFYKNGWCASTGNTVSGTTTGSCTGSVRIDVFNTGSSPVKLRTIYVDGSPVTNLNWTLGTGVILQCGNVAQTTPCNQLPVVIPVRSTVQVTLAWTPPRTGNQLQWLDVNVLMVSSNENFVDAHVYYASGMVMTGQSRPVNRVCPPCH